MHRWATMSSAITAPCFGPNGNLIVCTGSGDIVEFELNSNENKLPKAKIILQIDGQPNCALFKDKNEMIICDPSSQSLLIKNLDNNDNKISILCNEYENELFRGPSHCIIDSKGNKYFTDSGPLFGDTSIQSSKGSLFMINNKGILKPLAFKCLSQPTDLIFSPNEKCLYVLEMMKNRILRFVKTNHETWIYSVFYQFNGTIGPTGIDIDSHGNLFVTRFEYKGLNNTSGYLSIIKPSGKLIKEIKTITPEITGIAYDKNSNIIYITEISTNSIFTIHVDDIFKK